MATQIDCLPIEPDSVQISWNTPCDSGSWLFEPTVGCRMWDWHPDRTDTTTWTGGCKDGILTGYGVVQWYEHGRPIDRFDGTFVAGRRQGPGRYRWNEADWYVGFYDNDVPNGLGTAHIAGQTFSGQWRAGCFRQGVLTVAIGVPRKSCEETQTSSLQPIVRFPEQSVVSVNRLTVPVETPVSSKPTSYPAS
jgi:hypothetical protein